MIGITVRKHDNFRWKVATGSLGRWSNEVVRIHLCSTWPRDPSRLLSANSAGGRAHGRSSLQHSTLSSARSSTSLAMFSILKVKLKRLFVQYSNLFRLGTALARSRWLTPTSQVPTNIYALSSGSFYYSWIIEISQRRYIPKIMTKYSKYLLEIFHQYCMRIMHVCTVF